MGSFFRRPLVSDLDSLMPVQGRGGLEGVVAGTTELSMVDGQNGRLTYRGYAIGELAEHATFEEVCHLLWYGSLPTSAQLADLTQKMTAERDIPDDVTAWLKANAATAGPMDALRTAMSMLSAHDADAADDTHDANLRKALRITAKTATIVAAYKRFREGKDFVAPDASLGHAANFLYMINGEAPDAEIARDFDVALILHADHGYNASTFSARVVASSLSDIHSAVVAAIGSLKGPLHGGANEAVMRMLADIGDASKAAAYIEERLAKKVKIPGFGHRIYKTLDPRAPFLMSMSERLGKRAGASQWYDMSTQIQQQVKQLKGLDANVDFYSASTYTSMGIPMFVFTPIFALARAAGWTAHVIEQLDNNRLFRPAVDYTGPGNQAYVPLDKRG